MTPSNPNVLTGSHKPAVPPRTDEAPPSSANMWSTVSQAMETQRRLGAIDRVDRNAPLPLSLTQRRLWFAHLADPSSANYNLCRVWRLTGPLDLPALEKAARTLLERHEILRAVFHERDGEIFHRLLADPGNFFRCLAIEDLPGGDLDQWLREQVRHPIDLEHGPVLRFHLVRISDQEHVFQFVVHHLVFDGWSCTLLQRELAAAYQAFCHQTSVHLPQLQIQYVDYAHWQHESITEELLAPQLEYWKTHLNGAPLTLSLPTDHPRPARFDGRGAIHLFHIDPVLARALETFRHQEDTTLFVTLFSLFNVLLYRLTNQEDIIVGIPAASRTRLELGTVIGFFVNTLAIRTPLDGAMSYRALVKRIREGTQAAFTHMDVPFERIVEALRPERDPSRTPVYQVMFGYGNWPRRELQFEGLKVEPLVCDKGTADCDLVLELDGGPEGLRGVMEYSTSLFERATIERFAGYFQALLQAVLANPDAPIAHLSMLSDKERNCLLTLGKGPQRSWPLDRSYPALFAERWPQWAHHIALVDGDRELTYRELNAESNRIAHHLAHLNLEPETRVAICLHRRWEQMALMLGCWKAGMAYIPIDPAYPPDRITYMLTDSQARVVFTSPALKQLFPAKGLPVFLVEDRPWHGESDQDPALHCPPDTLAYVIYTSGSTGKPKGVGIEHRQLLNHNLAIIEEYGLQPDDRVLQFASASFDLSIEEIFPTWLSGGTLVLRTEAALQSPDTFFEWIALQDITVLNLPTAYWHELVIALRTRPLPKCVNRVIIGGEKAQEGALAEWLERVPPNVDLFNSYGPTETTITATLFRVQRDVLSADECRQFPIGRALANGEVYVVDRLGELAPRGMTGELWIGGAQVGRGYLGHPGLTADKFIPNPWGQGRVYKTGDLVRWSSDGHLLFAGRVDDQVKLRGFRIELGEVISTLRSCTGVREAVALMREDTPGQQRLVGYVASHDLSIGERVRDELRSRLPEYMVPATIVVLERLPKTPNGKLDQKALPVPTPSTRSASRAARDPLEQQLVRLWEKVLGISPIGIDDNFFDLGGHSLVAIRLFAGIEKTFGRKFPLATLFEAPTVERMAALVRHEGWAPSWSCLVPIQPAGSKPPFYCIHGVGGNIVEYLHLARYLGKDQPFYGIQAQGLDGRKPWLFRVEDMARVYIQEIKAFQPNGPYYFGGSSFGGTVAYEMAQQFRAQGDTVGLLVFFDTYGPDYPSFLPGTARLREFWYEQYDRFHMHLENLRLLDGRGRREYILEKLGKIVSNGRKIVRRHIKKFRKWWNERLHPREIRQVRHAGNRASEEYRPTPYDGRVVIFRATHQPSGIHEDRTLGWGPFVKHLEVYDTPGHHGAIVREPRARHLAEQLTERLERDYREQRQTRPSSSIASLPR